MTGLSFAAALASGVFAALFVAWLAKPPVRLAGRVRPYSAVSRSMLGRAFDLEASAGAAVPETAFGRVLGPPLAAAAKRFGQFIDSSSEDAMNLKLRQAAMLTETPPERRLQEYRMRQFLLAAAGAVGGFIVGLALNRNTAMILVLAIAGFAGGGSFWRSKIDRAIDERTARMRIELYTINQLLAMRVRVGGGVVSAVRNVVERGRGAVIDELGEALRLHFSGMSAGAAFRHIADLTPEPHARRAYQVLATADERGSDLAEALLALSEDIQEDRKEAIRRQAVRRRATMLIPIIVILAPILLLFVGAPLPFIVLRNLG
jgi:Flp pilus assembly protein TadB